MTTDDRRSVFLIEEQKDPLTTLCTFIAVENYIYSVQICEFVIR